MNNSVLESMLEEFDGCEGDDPGSPGKPSIWLFGIEPGFSIADKNATSVSVDPIQEGYTVDIQRKWPFNRNAFKLLAAINGYAVDKYIEFAYLHQPFVVGCKGYFKGNLYPYACNNVRDWPESAVEETGIVNKDEYKKWCRQNRWPEIAKWVNKYSPSIFIGVGLSCKDDFSAAVFGPDVSLDLHEFSANGRIKKIYYKCKDGKRLVVIPHLSRGLHENISLKNAGDFIAKLLKEH